MKQNRWPSLSLADFEVNFNSSCSRGSGPSLSTSSRHTRHESDDPEWGFPAQLWRWLAWWPCCGRNNTSLTALKILAASHCQGQRKLQRVHFYREASSRLPVPTDPPLLLPPTTYVALVSTIPRPISLSPTLSLSLSPSLSFIFHLLYIFLAKCYILVPSLRASISWPCITKFPTLISMYTREHRTLPLKPGKKFPGGTCRVFTELVSIHAPHVLGSLG